MCIIIWEMTHIFFSHPLSDSVILNITVFSGKVGSGEYKIDSFVYCSGSWQIDQRMMFYIHFLNLKRVGFDYCYSDLNISRNYSRFKAKKKKKVIFIFNLAPLTRVRSSIMQNLFRVSRWPPPPGPPGENFKNFFL